MQNDKSIDKQTCKQASIIKNKNKMQENLCVTDLKNDTMSYR